MKTLKYLFVGFMILGLVSMLSATKAEGNGAFVIHNEPNFPLPFATAAGNGYVAVAPIIDFGTDLESGTTVLVSEIIPIPRLLKEVYTMEHGLLYTGTLEFYPEGVGGVIIPDAVIDYYSGTYPPSPEIPDELLNPEGSDWSLVGTNGTGRLHITMAQNVVQTLNTGVLQNQHLGMFQGTVIKLDDDTEHMLLINVIGPLDEFGACRYPRLSQIKLF